MNDRQNDALKLENQLCFPLYACSRVVIKMYKPYLDKLDLTYTQYIALMILWQEKQMTVKEMGQALYLDSGTLTPLLKKLEAKGFLTRARSTKDERNLIVTITEKGEALKEQALEMQRQMRSLCPICPKESEALRHVLYKLIEGVEKAAEAAE